MAEFGDGFNRARWNMFAYERKVGPLRPNHSPLPEIPARQPVLIAGATASGKSALALRIAEEGGGVIVNADALQIWSCWRVLSARPAPHEMARAPHLLYGHLAPGADYSVGHWLREIAPILAAAAQGGPRPIIVGGTGLYLTALTEGLVDIPATPPEIRAEADMIVDRRGAQALIADLDPVTTGRIDLRNPMRVQRAWEVARATGRGLAAWQDETGPPMLPPATATTILVTADRDWLAERIDRRFDAMVLDGALDEVRCVLPQWDERALWSRAIGARELVAHLRGETDLETAIARSKAQSRQYAKRQRSWFRARMAGWQPYRMPQ